MRVAEFYDTHLAAVDVELAAAAIGDGEGSVWPQRHTRLVPRHARGIPLPPQIHIHLHEVLCQIQMLMHSVTPARQPFHPSLALCFVVCILSWLKFKGAPILGDTATGDPPLTNGVVQWLVETREGASIGEQGRNVRTITSSNARVVPKEALAGF